MKISGNDITSQKRKRKNLWFTLSILNLCIVAFLGFILRSKMLFALPGINYLYLLDTHFHFAFEGWVTLTFMLLLMQELLPWPMNERPVYEWLLAAVVLSTYGKLLTFPVYDNTYLANFFSVVFIVATYLFGWIFVKDVLATRIHKTIRLLSIFSIISLVLSSAGPITMEYLQATSATNSSLYRDAFFFYLHLQYNGFFTFTVFALLFNKIFPNVSLKIRRNFHWFTVLLCLSLFPSLFLAILWQYSNTFIRIVALTGSILTLFCVAWFIICGSPFLNGAKMGLPLVRILLLLSTGAFVVKMFLQSFTIFPSIGNAVYGDRPVIIGFLHLVFLGFVSIFILAYYLQKEVLSSGSKLTKYGLIVFLAGIAGNEISLGLQGIGAMLLKGSYIYSWLLWCFSGWLMAGAILLFIVRIRSETQLKS